MDAQQGEYLILPLKADNNDEMHAERRKNAVALKSRVTNRQNGTDERRVFLQKTKYGSVEWIVFRFFVFAAVVAVIGVLAASSVYVTMGNDATMKAVGIQPAPVSQHR